MKKYTILFAAAYALLFSCSLKKELQLGTIAIIPKPAELTVGEGYFEVSPTTTVSAENEAQAAIARRFFDQFEATPGWKPTVSTSGTGDIQLINEPGLAEESYTLDVTTDHVKIRSSSEAGFFYAFQSLKQLLPSAFYTGEKQANVTWGIPVVTVKDAPAFGWRGYMLDVSRHFFGPEQVKEVIDFMAELKLNRFHWHLSDDQGWRLEIKSYPKLTEVGAWRMDYNTTDETVSNWFGRPVQQPGEKPTYGGFYTQQEVKEIIAYAKERCIEVIPEIDMPGHAQATIAAYPGIGCVNAAPYVATGGVTGNNTYNPGKEETFVFAEKMLNEVMDLFPSRYVHIGGDECNKSQWRVDPDAQRRIREERLENEEELQSYFIKRIEKIINARDRIMIGWDEILEGGLAPNAVVMSWRGEEGGITSAKAGHEVIMTPNNYCYIDLKQGHDDLEPNLGYSQLLLSTAYSYQVIPSGLTPEEGKRIKGIQANMWTESISDWGKLTYMTFPRLYAIAENAWTAQDDKDWDDFTDRLYVQFDRLDARGVRYAVSAFSPWIDHQGNGETIEVRMKTEARDLDIYYTLDGSTPTLQSTKYEGPFILEKSAEVNARAFRDTLAVGYVSTLTFPVHKAAGATVTANLNDNLQNLPVLTDLSYGKLNSGDPAYQKLPYEVELMLTFDSPKRVKEVKFNALRFTISGIYPPGHIVLSGSRDGQNFTVLSDLDRKEVSHTQGRNKIDHTISFEEMEVKALKLKLRAPYPIPGGHHQAGGESSIMMDELIVH